MQDPHDLFSEGWARAWCRVLNESEAYRRAGAKWKGPIALVLDPDPARGVDEERAVRVDLDSGQCEQARAVTDGQLEATPTVIGGRPAAWSRVLAGDLDPLFALMSGKLQLRSGSLAELMPHAQGAKELVRSARQVPTRFPDGWSDGP